MAASSFHSVFRKDLFQNKTAIVTGGGTGIGFAIAKQLAFLGCTVVIGSRSKHSNKLQDAAAEINAFVQKHGAKATNQCIAIKLDVRSSQSITHFLDTLSNEHHIQQIDFLVNNAGGQFMSRLESITENGWKSVVDLNLTAIFLLSKAVFTRFWKSAVSGSERGGVIVNITANSFQGMPMMAHSGAARAGVENLTMVMAQNWSRYGVRSNCVAPGFIRSSGLETYPEAAQQVMALHSRNNYLYRMGTVKEVSDAVVFLLCDGASFITGTSLRVDGGESIFHPLLPPQPPVASKESKL